jgi:hypothetical protein
MALINTHVVSLAGTAPTFATAVAGDTARVGTGLTLIVKNASGSPITVTMVTPGNLDTGDAKPDKVYTVAATNGEQWIPLLESYADPVTGNAAITYSATTSVTRAVVKSYN